MKAIPTLLLISLATGCVWNDVQEPFDCSNVTVLVTLTSSQNVSACNAIDGSLSVSASGGVEPYMYSLNGGAFVSSSVFESIGTGTYNVVARDANGCTSTLTPSPTITGPNSPLATAEIGDDSDCLSDNGSITVLASGGSPPYTYRLEDQAFGNDATFTGLAVGVYTIMVNDSEDCSFTLSVTVDQGTTDVSWATDIEPIIDANCAVPGCHNGSRSPNLSTLAGVQANAQKIVQRTSNGSMPPGGDDLTADEVKKITCWVNDGARNN